ncbi:MAG: FecR domain-containing protein [Bdellovibrionota bacterium]
MDENTQSAMTDNNENNEKPKRRFPALKLPSLRNVFKRPSLKRPSFKLGVDSVILGMSSFTLLLSLALLLGDGSFFGGDDYGNLTAVGSFASSKNDVRRRVDAGMTWSNVNSTDVVYEGDSIFTGDSSETSIRLQNGTVLRVEPKSLVVIRTSGSKLEIDLQYGSLQGKIEGDQSIVLTQNGESQELSGKNTEVRIVKEEKAAARVQVVSGEVSLKDKTVVKKDEEVSLGKSGAKISKADVVLISPKSGAIEWLPMGKTVKFNWRTTKTGFSGVFEISKDPRFKSVLRSVPVSGTSIAVGDSQDVRGPLYWRVKSDDPNAIDSAAWKVSLFDDVPPLPILPANDQALRIPKASKSNDTSAFLTWEDSSGSTEFDLEVAKNPEMSKPFVSEKTTQQVSRVALAEGEYYWRVKGRHPERENAPWSKIMHFTVKKGDRELEAPILLVKKLDFKIQRTLLPKEVASTEPIEVTDAPAFEWSEVKGAKGYLAEFATDEAFSSPRTIDIDDATRFSPQKVFPGSAYFRVRAKAANGKVGKPSETGTINVDLPAPLIGNLPDKKIVMTDKKKLDAAKHDFKIVWSPLPHASKYELVWGSDPEFSKSKAFKINGTSRTIKVLTPRSYAAKVRALDVAGQPISAYSEVRIGKFEKELAVAKKKPVPVEIPKLVEKPAPKPTDSSREPAAAFGLVGVKSLEPKTDVSLVSLENAPTFVNFKWKAYKAADHYLIQIASDADFTKIVTSQKVKRSGFVYEDALPEGKIFWRVRAKTKKGFSEWSDVSNINVLYR